ncbi:trypsin-like peptidase domain-containing protein [Acinetobacter sp. ME22]|uniref:S1C family serine protease n=1 Tax=Acinetobacter sp. ME22 TaxID=2904802 RepID=UPI001EDBD383|nr:trypsin-like peptidase domain-containing protein [Acinetobacter sp. ME22]MCG2574826.1 trypsin-like peptidase domain-containing protein [Acinetobacter sp. ME22]
MYLACVVLCVSSHVAARQPDWAKIYQQASPSVVSIYALHQPNIAANQQTQFNTATSSYGSGFFIDQDGYILTNAHVIANASQILIRLNSKQQQIAQLIGQDRLSDLAVLKINMTVQPLRVAKNPSVKVGQAVATIGNPLGLEQSMTTGIISAPQREGVGEFIFPLLQSNLLLNVGYSGGPLLNPQGQVIGINTQSMYSAQGAIGVSFAIPIQPALQIAAQLKQQGHVSHAYLGAAFQTDPLTQQVSISAIATDSPAEKSGLQVGDIFLKWNHQTVTNESQIKNWLYSTMSKQQVELLILRQQHQINVSIMLSEQPVD